MKWNLKKLLVASIILFCLAPFICSTQTRQAADRNPARGRRGTIKGRVVADGGQPLAGIGINLMQAGKANSERRAVSTDEDGRFQADNLSPSAYRIIASVPGYVMVREGREPKTYRLGDDARIQMIKGGVITGVVKRASGEPVIGIRVRALRVRDGEGKPVRGTMTGRERLTDDKGVYRIYGLESGAYVVSTTGNTFSTSLYTEDAPTYYPSATRDTAAEVAVQTGQEAANIDITYRGEKGHAVSGSIGGEKIPVDAGISVILVHVANGAQEAFLTVGPRDNNRSFAIYGVPDGDYLITARLQGVMAEQEGAESEPRRLTVRGGDVTGLQLNLVPFASISGRLFLESESHPIIKCEGKKGVYLDEVLLHFTFDSTRETEEKRLTAPVAGAVDEKGEFLARNLTSGRYRLSATLPSETWYLKEAALDDTAKGKEPLPGTAKRMEVVSRGIALKAGEKVENLTVTIAEGAAGLSGKVVTSSDNEKLPSRLRVYLIPAERERADDLLRYEQAEPLDDAAFAFKHLAPGKYWLISKEISAEEFDDVVSRPAFWDASKRAALRKEAAQMNVTVTLESCQQVKAFALRYGLKNPPVKPAPAKTPPDQ